MVTHMKYLFGAVAALAVLILARHRSGVCASCRGSGAGSDASGTTAIAHQYRRHRLDAHLHRPGPDDDHPGPCPVLWRHGAQEERAGHAGPSFGATCIITVLWMIIGYSIAFTTNDSDAQQVDRRLQLSLPEADGP